MAAPLVTTAVVGVGVAMSGGGPDSADLSRYSAADDLGAAAARPSTELSNRTAGVSRDAERREVTALIDPKVTDRLWSTVDLDLRATPDQDARVLGEVKAVTRLRMTGQTSAGYDQVIVRDHGARTVAWVTADYLVDKKPTDPAHLPLSEAPCPDGSVEHGLTAGAVRVYRSVCHAFPQVTRYGGWDAHGEHSSGKALDIMTGDVQLGNAIAAFLQAHAAELDVFDVIWRQHIWTTQRAGDGWRSMPDRGSATANHYDHVHVSVY
jgi:hypothetical protein